MRAWNSLRLLLRTLVQRNIVDRELDAELRFHLEEQVAENLAAGMTPAETRRCRVRTAIDRRWATSFAVSRIGGGSGSGRRGSMG